MSTLRTIISCLVVLVLVGAPLTTARAGQQMSEVMAAELTQYPGSTVVFSNEIPGGNLVTNLNCGKTPPEEVADYYKAKLKENGYTINPVSESVGFIALKGERNVLVDFENENGDTVVTLVLSGGGGMTMSSGQPPGMPSMPGAMPQMPMSSGSPTQAAPTTPAMPTMPMAPAAPGMPGPVGTPGAGQAQYPEALTPIVAQYPNSRMMASHHTEEETAAVMTVGDPVEKVLDYYKSAISKDGWTKTNDLNVQGNIVLEFEKGDQLLVVTVQNAGGMLMATVALAKK